METENKTQLPDHIEYMGRVYDLTNPAELLMYFWTRW